MQTKTLSDYLCGLSYADLSPEVVENAKKCVTDLLGAALAGSVRPQGKIIGGYFGRDAALRESTVLSGAFPMLKCSDAAASNAAFGHVLDVDDVHNSSITHLGAVTIPAALAVGQKLKRSGREVITAITAGYEIGARVGEAIIPGSYHNWHTTAVVGGFSSAVAAGKLLGLPKEEMLSAIGSAGTQAAGLWEFINDGAMSKILHTANATLCGIRSAELAGLGFTGATRILEGDRGLLKAMTPQNHPEAITDGLGSGQFKILSNSFKSYACCRHTHSADDCAKRLRQRAGFDPEKIREIRDYTYRIAKETTDNAEPATAYGCKFSVQYCIAAMLLYGELNEAAFAEEKISSPLARRLMERTTVTVDPEIEAAHTADPNRWAHRLEVVMDDGSVLTETTVYPYGDFNNPFDRAAMERKFRTLTSGIISDRQADILLERVNRLEELTDVGELFAGL